MITAELDDRAARVWLSNMSPKVHAALRSKTYSLAEMLRSYVISDKLMGQVLKRVTGRLGQSIQQQVEETQHSVFGIVFSAGNIPYAPIHEYGGTIPAHDIVATKAQALAFVWQGKQRFFKSVHIPTVNMPERSYMRSSLSDKGQQIIQGLKEAVGEGIQP